MTKRMTYKETLEYLYASTPAFQRIGAAAYKPGLDTSIALDNHLGNPHKSYPTIHVGGTNGKGSVCHLLAAILQKSGYKVGLYTSPHLLDFRERIRVNGEKIPEAYVVGFVEKHKAFFEPLHPSFFELTSTMAFDYFRHEKVDYAVIEVGLGGRLDSTNIITPILSIITNIRYDHMQFLGNTLGEIAYEKAGIIKEGVPVVLGEPKITTLDIFEKKAKEMNAPLYSLLNIKVMENDSLLSESGEWLFDTTEYGELFGELGSAPQLMNAETVLCALHVLAGKGIRLPRAAVREGFEHVVEITGLQGRWQEVLYHPYTVLDVGHNEGAWTFLNLQIEAESRTRPHLYMIIGFSADKDIDDILPKMPKRAYYIFTQAPVERAMPAKTLAEHAAKFGLRGQVMESIEVAIDSVMDAALPDDMVFIGGSHFVVADAMLSFEETKP